MGVKKPGKSKLNSRYLVPGINAWAAWVLTYGAGIVEWIKEDLANLDRMTRKIMTMKIGDYIIGVI